MNPNASRRAMWRGVIHWNMLAIPVKLFTAIRPERISFHLLHATDGGRLRQQMVCPVDHQPVESGHILKGYPVSEDEYVLVRPEEIKQLAGPADRTVELTEFTAWRDLDARYMEKPYYLEPENHFAMYAALAYAMEKTGVAGLCQWTMRNRPYWGALRGSGGKLTLFSLRYFEEIVPLESVPLTEAKLEAREWKIARYLVETLAGAFHPESWRNEYENRLQEWVNRKIQGESQVVPPLPEVQATPDQNLLTVLEASLTRARSQRPAPPSSHAG